MAGFLTYGRILKWKDMAGFLTLILKVEDMAGLIFNWKICRFLNSDIKVEDMAGFLTLILKWKIWQVF